MPTGKVAPSDISFEIIEAASIKELPITEAFRIRNLWSSPRIKRAQCGEISPTNATVPIKATADDTKTELMVKTKILKRSVLIPSPLARSVPSLSAVNFQAKPKAINRAQSHVTEETAELIQDARCRLPKVHPEMI